MLMITWCPTFILIVMKSRDGWGGGEGGVGEIENKEHSNKGGFEGRCIVRNLV